MERKCKESTTLFLKESGAEQLKKQEDASALFNFLSEPFYPSTANTHNLTDKHI